jgi:hypothetical protein
MTRFASLSAAAALLFAGSAAMADPLPYTASVTAGTANNDLSLLSDGFVPPDYTDWDAASNVWITDPSTTIRFDFGGAVHVGSMLAAVDNNDDYIFTFYNGATQVYQATALASDGFVSVFAGGLETFEGNNNSDVHYYSPFDFGSGFTATSVVFSVGPNNDNSMGLGEVSFFGGAVPEPASWAMMVAGFGLAGAAMRRRARSALSLG